MCAAIIWARRVNKVKRSHPSYNHTYNGPLLLFSREPFIFSWPTNDLKRLGSSFFETFMMAGCKGEDYIGCGEGEDQNKDSNGVLPIGGIEIKVMVMVMMMMMPAMVKKG